jgi:SAM-dependent methyltransferase
MSDIASFERLFHNQLYWEFKNNLYNYRLRKDAIQAALNPALQPILEAGSGMSPILDPVDKVTHSDISFQAMRHLVQHGGTRNPLVCDANSIPLANGSVGAIVCSEVLEHIKQDDVALDEFARVLRTGGQLVLTVPLHRYFFTYDDRSVGHYRRYEIDELLQELRVRGFHGFHVRTVTGLTDKIGMLFATSVFALISMLQSERPAETPQWFLKTTVPIYSALNRIYGAVVRFEARWIPLALATIILVRAER